MIQVYTFLSIVLFNLSCNLTYLSTDNFLLMYTPWCTSTVSKTFVTIVDDILVATDGRELCLLVRLVLTSRKWFSLSLALGTNIVASITDRLSSDLPWYHDRAYVSTLPTFNPHGGPITQSSTGSKPVSPVQP